MDLTSLAISLAAINMAAEDLQLTADINCEHDELYIQFSANVPEDSRLGIILAEDGFRREEDYLFVRYV